jgi:hypothetical protein
VSPQTRSMRVAESATVVCSIMRTLVAAASLCLCLPTLSWALGAAADVPYNEVISTRYTCSGSPGAAPFPVSPASHAVRQVVAVHDPVSFVVVADNGVWTVSLPVQVCERCGDCCGAAHVCRRCAPRIHCRHTTMADADAVRCGSSEVITAVTLAALLCCRCLYGWCAWMCSVSVSVTARRLA